MAKLFSKVKDGGPDSPVDAFFLVEIKGLFSIALLRFNKGGREAYHSHAFNALTWFFWGDLVESTIYDNDIGFHCIRHKRYKRSWLPKFTPREQTHRVYAGKTSWCFTLRGPWLDFWTEVDDDTHVETTFTHGRIITKMKSLR